MVVDEAMEWQDTDDVGSIPMFDDVEWTCNHCPCYTVAGAACCDCRQPAEPKDKEQQDDSRV